MIARKDGYQWQHIPNKKESKIVSYKFKCCLGRDENSKQIFRCTTWKVPEGLTPSKAQKTAEKAAAVWEKETRDEYENDKCDPERIRAREIARTKTDFSDFALNTWLPICICDGGHKPTTVAFYRNITNEVIEYFGRVIN